MATPVAEISEMPLGNSTAWHRGFDPILRSRPGKQTGDPDKAVKVMLKAIDSDAPPPRAYVLARTKLADFIVLR